MVGLSSLFDIARSALTASQRALTVTGHNVANVNTPGYSRQEAVLAEQPPLHGQPGMVGMGVRATAIRRYTDFFVNKQLTAIEQNLGRLSVSKDELFRLQNLFSDSNNQGIAARLNELFRGLQDVSTTPGGLAARSVLLANAKQLASSLNQASADLISARQSLNFQVQQTVEEINSLSKQLATLNGQIVAAEVTGQSANDLRDQRDGVVNELAKRIDITTIEAKSGALTVFAARGQVLVDGATIRQLGAIEDPDNEGLFAVGYSTGGARPLSIDGLISNGRLRSLLDVRDITVKELEVSFDRLTATLTNAVNTIHRQGYDLDGSTGREFFGPGAITTSARAANQGAVAVNDSAVTANSLLTFHDYEIRFSSPTVYSIVDTTTGASIRGNYTGTSIVAPSADTPVTIVTGVNDTLAVTVDGVASGTITLAGAASPGLAYSSGAALAQEVQAKINADGALQSAGKSVVVTYDVTTNRLVISSNNATSASAVNVTGGTARTSLGMLSGTGTASSGTYTSPMTVIFDGMSVSLTGTAAAGDVLEVNSYDDAAKHVAVALTDPSTVAASSTKAGPPGNNTNMLALVALQHRQFASLDGGTLKDAYRTAAANLGVAAQTADRETDAQETLKDQIETLRAQVSGVSIDEELVNLIKFQRGFEAASRLVRMTDEMFQTLLSLKPY
ncbi:MAG: flagellar hook-associated protein FlgK [Nitrospira sp.]|nr:flagellar hook-associated protein FlgK [Nitrospira sp.]MDH4302522.1 flagellar hook-associated protein FlgK [Nitrospira sp.]MDH5192366.1 flagellar hook-associated protein FlgK [Nitrospira sp.]